MPHPRTCTEAAVTILTFPWGRYDCVFVCGHNLSVLRWAGADILKKSHRMNPQPWRALSLKLLPALWHDVITDYSPGSVDFSLESRACRSLKWLDVWRLHFIVLFLPSSNHPPTNQPALTLSFSLTLSPLFPPPHVSLQRAVAVRQHHGGWMCGCRGDWERCLRTPGWTRK